MICFQKTAITFATNSVNSLVSLNFQNTRMQCSVYNRFIKQFDTLFKENTAVYIDNPSLAPNPGKRRHVENDQKIVMKYNTKVTVANSFTGHRFGFVFAEFGDILSKKVADKALIDVIGCVIKVIEKEKPTDKRRTIQIQDIEKNIINVTLWDSFCNRFEEFIKDHPNEKNVVIILQCCKFEWFLGKPYVYNSFDASRLWINEDIDELNLFKNSLVQMSDTEESTNQQTIADSIVSFDASIEDEFLKSTRFSFISEIGAVNKETFLTILGTIKAIDKDTKWFFESCDKCFKMAILSEDKMKVTCTNQNCEAIETTSSKRYRISIRVVDSTGTVTITMFDRDAKRLLGISVADLLNDSDEFDGDETVPKRFNLLLEKKMSFKIHVKAFNLNHKREYYTIMKCTEDISVVSALEHKFHADEDIHSISLNSALDYLPFNGSVISKDMVTSTDDNVTPVTNVNSDAKKQPIGESSSSKVAIVKGLKRNLSHVYEADDSTTTSSANFRSTKITKDTDNVLIPKVEK